MCISINRTHNSILPVILSLAHYPTVSPLIARFMGPTWGPSGAVRTQVGPMLAPWTLLSGTLRNFSCISILLRHMSIMVFQITRLFFNNLFKVTLQKTSKPALLAPLWGEHRARFQKRSARDRLRYDPVILIGRSHSTNADHDRLIRSRKYETKQFIANWIMT